MLTFVPNLTISMPIFFSMRTHGLRGCNQQQDSQREVKPRVRPIKTLRREVLSGRCGGLSGFVTLSVKVRIMATTQPPFYQLDALPPFFDKRRSCSILRHYCILTTALMFLRQDLGRVISSRESHRKEGYCNSHFVRGGTGNSGEDRCTHAAKLFGERPFIRVQRFLMLNTELNVGSSHPQLHLPLYHCLRIGSPVFW